MFIRGEDSPPFADIFEGLQDFFVITIDFAGTVNFNLGVPSRFSEAFLVAHIDEFRLEISLFDFVEFLVMPSHCIFLIQQSNKVIALINIPHFYFFSAKMNIHSPLN